MPPRDRELDRNFLFGVLNGALFGFVDAMMAPALTLALFVSQLGGSNLLIGFLPAIYNGGWFFPQFLISHRIQRLPRKMPFYLVSCVVRMVAWGIVCLATLLLGPQQPSLLLIIFFIFFVIYSFAAGFGGSAFMTIVAKTIPMQRRGTFFGWRELTGTGTGLLASYLITVALAPERGLAFPSNFAILFVLLFGMIGLGFVVFSLVTEHSEQENGAQATFFQQLRAARTVWNTDARYRRFLLTRFVLAAGDLATPFYAIFAIRQLGAPEDSVGLYIGLTTLVAVLSNPGWSWLGDHRRLHWVLVGAAALTPLMPLLAIVMGLLSRSNSVAVPFALVFVIYGAARTAANIAFPTFLLNLAPPETRTLYIGLTNTVLGVATFVPVVGGVLVDLYGFTPLFLITLATASLATWLALGLVRLATPVSGTT